MADEPKPDSKAMPDSNAKPDGNANSGGDAKPASQSAGGGPDMPSRAPRREPPTIDAKAAEVKVVTPSGSAKTGEPQPSASPKPLASATATAPAVTTSGAKSGPAAPSSPPASSATPASSASAATPASGASSKSGGEAIEPEASSPDPGKDAVQPAPAGAASPASGKPRNSLPGILGAGLAGAVVALAGGYVLISPRLPSADLVGGQIAASEKKLSASLASAGDAQRKALEEKLSLHATAQAKALETLTARVGALEKRAQQTASDIDAARQAATATAPRPVDLSPLETRAADLDKRIAAIENALQSPKSETRASDPDVRQPPPTAPVSLAPLEARLKALEARPAPKPVDLAPLETRLKQLEQQLGPVAGRIAPLEQKLAPLESGLAQAREAVAKNAKNIETSEVRANSAALAVVANSLAEAVHSGRPFGNLLEAALALGVDKDAAARLAGFAGKGIPTLQSLAAGFRPLGTQILDLAAKPANDASLTEKLASTARQLVRISPAETTKEETPAALVVRISAALTAGRAAEALDLYQKLPEPIRKAAEGWAASLRNRVEADRAVASILSSALARLGRSKT